MTSWRCYQTVNMFQQPRNHNCNIEASNSSNKRKRHQQQQKQQEAWDLFGPWEPNEDIVTEAAEQEDLQLLECEAVEVEVDGDPAPTEEAAAPAAASAAAIPARAWIESERGYISIPSRARPVGQITCWTRSISARCLLHPQCRRAYTVDALPSASTLAEWLLAGMDLAGGATGATAHMGLPKPIRDQDGGSS